MPIRVITAPTAEPVTLAEAKAQLRLEHTADDDFVASLIKAAREYVEQVCWRGLVTQTLELTLNRFPSVWCSGSGRVQSPFWWSGYDAGESTKIELPLGKLASVASVKYVDMNGVEQTVSPSDYSVDTASIPGRIYLAFGKVWPDARPQWDAVRIRYDVGEAVSALPQSLKQAVLLLISQMYEFRTSEVTGTIISSVHFAFDALVSSHRLVRY